MKILEKREIKSSSDIGKLGIVDWNRLNGYWKNDVTAPLKIIDIWLAGHASYTIFEDDLTKYPEQPGWPDWQHAGNGWHEKMGRLYWNMFHSRFNELEGKLYFHDSPDFSGTLAFSPNRTTYFFGDIGQVSASTFIIEGIMCMNTGDLWISLVNEGRQVVIESHADIQRVYSEYLESIFLGGEFPPKPTKTHKVSTPKPRPTPLSLWGTRP